MDSKKRFIIKGFHSESDSEWIQEESFDEINEDLKKYYDELPSIDDGLGWYEVWDTQENKSIDLDDFFNAVQPKKKQQKVKQRKPPESGNE